MAIVDLFVKSDSSPRLSADDATVQHQMALLLHGDYTKWAWLSFSAATLPIYSLILPYILQVFYMWINVTLNYPADCRAWCWFGVFCLVKVLKSDVLCICYLVNGCGVVYIIVMMLPRQHRRIWVWEVEGCWLLLLTGNHWSRSQQLAVLVVLWLLMVSALNKLHTLISVQSTCVTRTPDLANKILLQ